MGFHRDPILLLAARDALIAEGVAVALIIAIVVVWMRLL